MAQHPEAAGEVVVSCIHRTYYDLALRVLQQLVYNQTLVSFREGTLRRPYRVPILRRHTLQRPQARSERQRTFDNCQQQYGNLRG